MAKNSKTGALVVSTRTAVQHDGIVESVTESGVTITSREFGRQTKTENFYPFNSIIAHSDEGEGFVIVMEDEPVAVYHGEIASSDGIITVTTEGGRQISSGTHPSMTYKVVYDGESGLTTLGKEGKRRSARFDTKSDKSGGGAKKKSSKSEEAPKKKKVAGKRRD